MHASMVWLTGYDNEKEEVHYAHFIHLKIITKVCNSFQTFAEKCFIYFLRPTVRLLQVNVAQWISAHFIFWIGNKTVQYFSDICWQVLCLFFVQQSDFLRVKVIQQSIAHFIYSKMLAKLSNTFQTFVYMCFVYFYVLQSDLIVNSKYSIQNSLFT